MVFKIFKHRQDRNALYAYCGKVTNKWYLNYTVLRRLSKTKPSLAKSGQRTKWQHHHDHFQDIAAVLLQCFLQMPTHTCTHTHKRFMDKPGETVPEKNIHSLTPIVVTNHLLRTHPSDHSSLPLKCHLIFLSYGPGLTSIQHTGTTLHATAVQSPSYYQWCTGIFIGKQWYQRPGGTNKRGKILHRSVDCGATLISNIIKNIPVFVLTSLEFPHAAGFAEARRCLWFLVHSFTFV